MIREAIPGRSFVGAVFQLAFRADEDFLEKKTGDEYDSLDVHTGGGERKGRKESSMGEKFAF